MELFACLSCGNEFYVHCIYPIPEKHKVKNKLFNGYYYPFSKSDAVKNYLKLKGILVGCEWFQLSSLERQKLEGKSVWELGKFLDVEVEKIKSLCLGHGIKIEFIEIVEK